ncbi:unnamed protein product [Jaminaea pallidilutea]
MERSQRSEDLLADHRLHIVTYMLSSSDQQLHLKRASLNASCSENDSLRHSSHRLHLHRRPCSTQSLLKKQGQERTVGFRAS